MNDNTDDAGTSPDQALCQGIGGAENSTALAASNTRASVCPLLRGGVEFERTRDTAVPIETPARLATSVTEGTLRPLIEPLPALAFALCVDSFKRLPLYFFLLNIPCHVSSSSPICSMV